MPRAWIRATSRPMWDSRSASGASQSPFALARGAIFEAQVKANGAADLVRLLRDRLGLDLPEVSYSDLESVGGNTEREVRYQRTRALLLRAARHPDEAGTLVRPPDAANCRSGAVWRTWNQTWSRSRYSGKFHVIEIKSFAVIDGQADEESVAAAAMQSAAYILALQDLLTAESLPASCRVHRRHPGHAGRISPARPRPRSSTYASRSAILRRQLARMTRIDALVDELPEGLTFDLAPDRDGSFRRPRDELARALESVPGPVPAALPEDMRAGRVLPRRSPHRRRADGARVCRPGRSRRPG